MARFERNEHLWELLLSKAHRQAEPVDTTRAAPLSSHVVLAAAQKAEFGELFNRMGIHSVRQMPEDWGDGILFECAAIKIEGGRAIKGYAYLPDHTSQRYDSLDAEPKGYEPGRPILRAVRSPPPANNSSFAETDRFTSRVSMFRPWRLISLPNLYRF